MAACRVIVVDDNRVILDVLTRTLSGCGYDVSATTRPHEALNIVRSQPPFDLVLSDVVMPEMHGTDLVREIAQLTPETACILMTGGVHEATSLPSGVPILYKPFLRNDLIAAVERAIARSAELKLKLRESIAECSETVRKSMRLRSESQEVRRRSIESRDRRRLEREQRNDKPEQ